MTQAPLLINGVDAYAVYGVRMGDDFISTLTQPLTLKDPIVNESRIENGKRVTLPLRIFYSARDVTLNFTIEGRNPDDFARKRSQFLAEIYKGGVEIQVPTVSDEIFRLIYLGFGATYGLYPTLDFCHMALKFTEPNPRNRGESGVDPDDNID